MGAQSIWDRGRPFGRAEKIPSHHQRRVLREKTIGPQCDPLRDSRQCRPVLRSRDVPETDRAPDDDIARGDVLAIGIG